VKKYTKVCLGGTFDRIHIGHERLLKIAFEVGEEVIIGLTSDTKAKRGRVNEKLSSFKNRYTNLENFLSKQFDINFSIVELNDDWGPGALDEDLDAIIVSEETEKVASELNKKRALEGLNPLDIVTVSLILDKKGEKISSTRIRNSEIDREGNKA
jgi:pantetheine-phosphate adenylyltransferase